MRPFVKKSFAVFCMVVAACSAFANLKGDLYEIPFTIKAPVIDGKMDAVWKTVDNNFQNSYDNSGTPPDDPSDLTGWSRIMWDQNFLYGYFFTMEDLVIDGHVNTWERDGWELYFDADNSKGSTSANGADYDGVNDIGLLMSHACGSDVNQIVVSLPVSWAADQYWASSRWNRVEAGVKMAVRDTSLGFIIEWRIPLESLYIEPVAGSLIGLELQQDDNDSGRRDHISKWWLREGDATWNDASSFGIAVLSGRRVGEELVIGKSSAPPVIDGELDNVWLTDSAPYSQNFYANGGMEPDDYSDLYGSGRLLWDEHFIYGFFYAQDDIVVDEHANFRERDGWEVFFDADNSRGSTAGNGEDFDGVNDVQLFFNHAYGTDASQINVGLPVLWSSGEYWANSGWDRVTAGVKMAVKDTDKGYNIEWRIPLESLYLETREGTPIGYESHMDDNDGNRREHVSKWWVESGDPSWNNASSWGTAIFMPTNSYQTGTVETGWQVELTVSGSGVHLNRSFGAHSSGTDGYDSRLDVMSPPPGLAYYAFFQIPMFPNSLSKDIRRWAPPYDAELNWTLKVVNADQANGLISWDPSGLPERGGFMLTGDETIDMRTAHSAAFSGNKTLTIRYSPLETDTRNRVHLPTTYGMSQNYPNPFNPETCIVYSLPGSVEVEIAVYDMLGRRVRTLVNGNREAGSFDAVWDGRDERGIQLGSGVYLVKMRAGSFSSIRKVMLMR